MSTLKEVNTPCFIVNRRALANNTIRMLEKANSLNITLRPHIKTHKTFEGACFQLFGRQLDRNNAEDIALLRSGKICVSTLGEAKFYGEKGIGDILYAVPLNPSKLPILLSLIKIIPTFNVMIDNLFQLEQIEKFANENNISLFAFLNLNSGGNREGVNVEEEESYSLALRMWHSSSVKLRGFYTHAGHSYKQKTRSAMNKVIEIESDSICYFSDRFFKDYLHFDDQKIIDLLKSHQFFTSIGSTPSLSRFNADQENGDQNNKEDQDDDLASLSLILNDGKKRSSYVNEMHAGNYIFYDYSQYALGSCALSDCSAFVLSSVISHYKERREMLLDCGALSLSKDMGPSYHLYSPSRPFSWGYVKGFPDLLITSITQELAIVKLPPHLSFDDFPIDSRLQIIPNHSCLTAACYPSYHVIDAQNDTPDLSVPVVDNWETCLRVWA